ncbi:putative ankyrin repeat domain protein [Aspergillus bombycis]|uniref:Putative ankyrin repeat domain protein n=1 Tax=Aspergillus bombycis TaxID=109264 RepID=A0A1F8A1W9_9EURO|nr:putative ankyrin repeat domain protein [Aspergillus bombycis]OGM45308.1 putative ankyrin repeat domain protein [Aspergillus bombycis]
MDNDDFVLVEKRDGELTPRSVNTTSKYTAKLQLISVVTSHDIDQIEIWLSPTEFETEGSEYQKHLSAHTSGTGDWLFHTDQYQTWHDENINTLWLQGIPGSGKSVMAAKLIRTFKEEGMPVLFFFARRIIKTNSEPRQLVQDCLYQLLGQSALLQARLKMLLALHPTVDSVPFHELWNLLLFGIDAVPKVYVLLDALDELAVENDGFLQSLQKLGQQSPKSIKLIITSRPEAYLQTALRGPFQNRIRLAGEMVDQDIATYIAHRLGYQQNNPAVAESQSVVQEKLSRKAQGLFLYARLMLDQILLQSELPVKKHLQHLPSSMEEMYVSILHEHSSRSGASQHFQCWLLSWVTHACRPLRITELAALVNASSDRSGLSSSQDAKIMIRRSCGPLLEILDNETVQVIHHSFTEFLLDRNRNTETTPTENSNWFPVLTPTSTHRSLTLLCVDYLLSGCFRSWSLSERPTKPADHEPDRKQLMVHFPFLQYASQNLLYHAAKCDSSDPEFILQLDALFQNEKHSFESWKDFIFAKMNQTVPDSFHPIHLAAQAGLSAYTQHLLKVHGDPDVADSFNRTAVTYACMHGQFETLAALLGYNASFITIDIDGLTPIHHAARGNHVKVVQLLLEAGADPMSPKSCEDQGYWRWSPSTLGKTPVQYASELGHTACVLELLRNLDLPSKSSVLPHWASATGQSKTLEALLRHPAVLENLDKRDSYGNTALFLAARRGEPETVRILLHYGANVNARSFKLGSSEAPSDIDTAKSGKGQTPIHAWTAVGYRSRSEGDVCSIEEWKRTGVLLIKAGCDLEAKNDAGQTALFAWTKQYMCAPRRSDRTERFVELLLKHGANPCATDNKGNTPLHNLTSDNMNSRVLELFVNAGANINHGRHGDLVTPLISAAMNKSLDVTPLIENGADPNLQDSDGNTALHHICASWMLRYSHVQKWLESADPTVKNKAGETCLYKLAFGNDGHERVKAISLFTEKGLDLESRDRRGRTALLAACANAETHFIIGLLENGANAKAIDFQHKSCLHLVAQVQLALHGNGEEDLNSTLKIMKLLMQEGVDINGVDMDGNTPFHDAVVSDAHFIPFQTKLEVFLELGGLANTTDYRGQTVLHKVANITNPSTCDRIDFLLQPNLGLDVSAQDNEGLAPIHCASSKSEIITWRLIQAGADIQAQSDDGRSPLHFAAAAAQSNVVGLLCKLYKESSWSLDQKDDHGCTPLHYAASSGNSECVYHLLQVGAQVNIADCHGRTPLHMAAEHKVDVAALRKQRKYSGGELWGQVIGESNTLRRFIHPILQSDLLDAHWNLSFAIEREDEAYMMQDIVQLLLGAGADINMQDSSGQTACDVALHLGHDDVWNALSIRTKQCELRDLMGRVCSSKRIHAEDIVQGLSLERADAYNLLQTAISLRNEAVLDALLRAGVDLLTKGPDGLTPVHYVAHWGLLSMMKAMAPYVKDINAFSPPLLHVVAGRELSNLQMIVMLIGLGIDINASYEEPFDVDSDEFTEVSAPKYTATHILAAGRQWWNIAALETLCNAGADLEITDSDGNTVLQCALSGKSHGQRNHGFWRNETLEVALRHGANINKLSPNNDSTPLLVALETNRGCKLVQRLLDHGADINLGHVPALFAAIKSRDCDAITMILNAGADVNAVYYPKRRYGTGPKIETPLLAAALEAREVGETVMALLLQRGANPLLELEDSNSTVLHQIAHHHGRLGPILKSRPDVLEATDCNGLTPLLSVCSSVDGYYMVEESTSIELICAGANINVTDKDGSTPLHLAIRSGKCKTVAMLLERGAPSSITDNAGLSPLYYALSYSDGNERLEMTNALLTAGANPLITGPNGETALHILAPLLVYYSSPDNSSRSAKETYHQAELKNLYVRFVESGCDVNFRDARGDTPLFPFVRTIKERDEYGIGSPPAEEDVRQMFQVHDIFAVNDNGDTLLHAIAGREDTRMSESEPDGVWLFEELMACGLDARKENKQGLTALDVAAARGMQGIMRLFEKEQ